MRGDTGHDGRRITARPSLDALHRKAARGGNDTYVADFHEGDAPRSAGEAARLNRCPTRPD